MEPRMARLWKELAVETDKQLKKNMLEFKSIWLSLGSSEEEF